MELPENNEHIKESHGILYLIISVFLVILSFFILMNAISSKNTQKTADIAKSLKHEFVVKTLGQKVEMFNKRMYEQQTGTSSSTFKDIISSFLESQKNNSEATLSENKANNIINIQLNNFFGLNNPEARPAAKNFLASLNHFIEINRKNPGYIANLIMVYDDKNESFVSSAILSLYSTLDYEKRRNISFSVVPTENNKNKEMLDKIYIFFDKNEF